MKIAVISTHYEGDIGGAEVSTKLLVSGLVKAGHEVDVYSFGSRLKWMPLGIKAFLLNTSILDNYVSRWLYSSLKDKNYDVVHFQDLMLLPGGVVCCKKLRIKSVATVRDLRFICNLAVCQQQGKLFYGCSGKTYLKCLKCESRERFGVSSLAYFIKPFISRRADELCVVLNSVNRVVAVSKFVQSELFKVGIASNVIYDPMPEWNKCFDKDIKNESLWKKLGHCQNKNEENKDDNSWRNQIKRLSYYTQVDRLYGGLMHEIIQILDPLDFRPISFIKKKNPSFTEWFHFKDSSLLY